MRQILLGMLKVENEDQLSLCELYKEIIKENKIIKDSENNIMIVEERKQTEISSFVYIQSEYLRNIIKKRIRSDLILKYNNKPNERII